MNQSQNKNYQFPQELIYEIFSFYSKDELQTYHCKLKQKNDCLFGDFQ